MNDFISLSDGTIINLGALAYISIESGPKFPQERRGISLVFPAVTSRIEDLHTFMELSYNGKEADEVLSALEQRGIDVAALRKAREPGSQKPVVNLDVLSKASPPEAKGPKQPWMGRKDKDGKTTYRIE